MSTHIFLIRHGETTWNVSERIQGVQDVPLTDAGKRQADEVAERFAQRTLSFAYTSPLSRAMITAATIAAPHHLKVVSEYDLREREYGSMEGQPMMKWGKFYLEDSEAEGLAQPAADAETEAEVAQRMRRVLTMIAKEQSDKTGFLVSHGGTIQAFLREQFPKRFARLRPVKDIHNVGWVELIVKGGDFRVGEMNGVDRVDS